MPIIQDCTRCCNFSSECTKKLKSYSRFASNTFAIVLEADLAKVNILLHSEQGKLVRFIFSCVRSKPTSVTGGGLPESSAS